MVRYVTGLDTVTYVHLTFAAHEIVTVNNAPSESLHAGNVSKADMEARAREELFNRFPQLRCAPANWQSTARKALTVSEGRLLV